ncbi:transposase [Thermodesulfovibrionales bacterium]|nr:transposase [Thermodesulfovibrionales bacterium]
MGRPLRIEYPGALYHITNRGNERRAIFTDDSDRSKFLEILKDYHKRYGILIHSYVLMDNHYHLVIETPQGNLLKVMHGLNGGYTGYYNRRYGRSGHLFQGRYKGISVDKSGQKMREIYLSKTDFLEYLQCQKNFWLKKRRPELYNTPILTDFEKSKIREGYEVETYFRKLFPEGVLLNGNPEELSKETKRLISLKKSAIFQATFIINRINLNLLAKVDVLAYNKESGF